MTMLPKVVHELCADEPAAANHDDLHMFIHIAGAERFAFHNGSSIRQVVIFVSHRLSVTAIHEMNSKLAKLQSSISPLSPRPIDFGTGSEESLSASASIPVDARSKSGLANRTT